jgi:hypothetical protein
MAVTYGFYDSLNGDRKYNATQMSRLFEGVISDGIMASVGQALVVSAAGGMVVNVGTGRAWFNYTWTLNDTILPLTVDAAETVLNRIDSVILEVNTDFAVRANTIRILKGSPAASPVAPSLANTATLKQVSLADIFVGANVTSINAGNITNKVGSAGTPLVTALVPTIDQSTLLGRFESEFNSWLSNLTDQLDDNQAGNLQAQIDVQDDRDKTGWIAAPGPWTYNSSQIINIPTNGTLIYQKGWGVRYKQGGAYKYMYITSVAANALFVTGGTDYFVSNAAITDIYYSPMPANAWGFPAYFTSPATLTGAGGSAGAYAETVFVEGRFSITGGTLKYVAAKMVNNKGSWTGSVSLVLPVSPATPYSGVFQGPVCWWANGALAGAGKAVLRLVNAQAASFLDAINSSFFDWADMAVNDFLLLDISYWI